METAVYETAVLCLKDKGLAMTPATKQKREAFTQFIERVLAPETAVQAVIGIGSIATGRMRPDSDIDAIIFLEPYDLYIVPAEAIWDPKGNTFHSIFTDDQALQERGLSLDFARLDLQQWRNNPDFEWPEARKAEISAGWLAFDRSNQIKSWLDERTEYPEEVRLTRLDEALIWLDQHLHWKDPKATWEKLGPAIAHDRLQAAYNFFVQALFAYNRQWRIWRNREMEYLLHLSWLPDNFEERVLTASNAPALTFEGYSARVEALRALFEELMAQLIDSGDYSHAPVDQAFVRANPEPGRSWNMDEWNRMHRLRQISIDGVDEAAL